MTVRLRAPAFPGAKETVFHAHHKVAHRAMPDAVVAPGNHYVDAPGLEPLRAWYPIEVFHFSFRSLGQLERKANGGWHRNRSHEVTLHHRLLHTALHEGRLPEHYDSFAIDDHELATGLADGTLAIDTRLRDALRAIRAPDGRFPVPDGALRVAFDRPDVGEDAQFAAETSALVQLDGIVRAGSRVDLLERRLAELERHPFVRLGLRRRLRGAAVD
jgi:hypothetical protein